MYTALNTRFARFVILLWVSSLVSGLVSSWVWAAQPDQAQESASVIEARGIALMQRADWEGARDAFAALVELKPKSYVGHYNLASALSRLDLLDESQASMKRAIALGFLDRAQLLRDGDLVGLRTTEYFTQLMTQWDATVQTRRSIDLARMNQLARAKKMQHRTIEELRLEIVSAHDPVSTDQAVAELELITEWAREHVFGSLDQSRGMGGGTDSPWIMVGLPDRRGFGKWVIETFGPGVQGNISSVGGAYEHQQRRLVAQDLGATLRHEYVHVLHWRDMSRIGQNHAAWIQEGLASVVEDYEIKRGKLVPVPSWRTNMVKRLLRARKLPKITELASMDLATFTRRRPLARYAHARTILMWLHARNQLGAFYKRYTESFDMDPTGIQALENATGMQIGEAEEAYRSWMEGIEQVPETGSDLDATLGLAVENGTGDGVVIRELSTEARRRTGLRMGSVITAIEGRPTRDLHELIRVLGSYGAGEVVTVHWRRGTLHNQSEVELIKR
ncbi:MAG: hypothetical protein AB8C13_09545 [Phycisphaerales bacterium]